LKEWIDELNEQDYLDRKKWFEHIGEKLIDIPKICNSHCSFFDGTFI